MIRWVGKHPVASIAILFLFLIPLLVGTLVLIFCESVYVPCGLIAAAAAIAAFLLGLVITGIAGVAAFDIHQMTAKALANSRTKPNR